MERTDIDPIELQYLNLWFANIVDALNYNLGLIEDAVQTLDTLLTTLDTPPIEYLKQALDDLVKNINSSFEDVKNELDDLKQRIDNLGG